VKTEAHLKEIVAEADQRLSKKTVLLWSLTVTANKGGF